MDAYLSFTTISIFTDTDTYTDHGHGSQFTDLWTASLSRPSRRPSGAGGDIKAGVDRCSFQTKNQMVFVKKTHCKMWLYFDMVGHRGVIKGY